MKPRNKEQRASLILSASFFSKRPSHEETSQQARMPLSIARSLARGAPSLSISRYKVQVQGTTYDRYGTRHQGQGTTAPPHRHHTRTAYPDGLPNGCLRGSRSRTGQPLSFVAENRHIECRLSFSQPRFMLRSALSAQLFSSSRTVTLSCFRCSVFVCSAS